MTKTEKIDEIISKTLDVPSNFLVALKVIEILKDDYLSIDEIEQFLSKDKGFTARFLRIANSPYYGLRRKIKSVKDALILIGVDTAKSLILATSSRYLYKRFGEFEQYLWEHSLAVGLFASLVSLTKGLIKPEEALASGILHDIGKVFLNNAMPELYQKVHEKIIQTGKSTIEIEEEILGVNHTEVGAAVAKKWNYPDEIDKVIEYHHTKPYPKKEDKKYETFCNLIRVSDQICLDLGIWFNTKRKTEIDYQDIEMDENSLMQLKRLFIQQFNEQKKFLLE